MVENPRKVPRDALVLVASEVGAAFSRDGLLRVRGILPVHVAQAVCQRVHEELAARKGDASYFGDVYGYEVGTSCVRG